METWALIFFIGYYLALKTRGIMKGINLILIYIYWRKFKMNEEFTTNEEVMENDVVFNEVERVDDTLPAEVPEDDYDVEESEQKGSVAGTVATVALVGAIGIGAVVGMTKLYRKIREKIAKKHEPEQKPDGDSVIDVTADSVVYDASEDQVEESSKTEEKVDIFKNFDSTKKDEKEGK